MSAAARLRPATQDDVPLITQLIQELAEYEKLAHTCVADDTSVRENLFGDRPAAEVVLAFIGDEPAGFALYYENYSTHLSRRGMHLEDLYVREHLRGKGDRKVAALPPHVRRCRAGLRADGVGGSSME